MTALDAQPPGHAAGIGEDMIRTLVEAFYARVRSDEELGPIFEAAITDWPAHLSKLCDFWSSVLLMSGRFKGAPMRTHALLPRLEGRHFDRWLEIFSATAKATCPPDAAEMFVDRAHRIAHALEHGIAVHRGQPLRAHASGEDAR